MPEEPRSWAELLQTSRKSAAPAPELTQQTRFTRTGQGVTPLAEGGAGHALTHTLNAADGSLQRSQWHGWGSTSLLKQDAPPKQPQQQQQPAPRSGMFGLLQGTDAGAGADAWIGNPAIDPTKGRRALRPAPAPRCVDMTQLLAQTALPCSAGDSGDAWLGNISIDPARGKGHAADPAALRGRNGLASILQQSVLREASAAHGRPAATATRHPNTRRLIQPGKGRRPVSSSPAAAAALHGAAFSGPPPASACWCDMPRIGRRPLPPPSAAGRAVTAAQTLAMEVPLPPGAVVGPRKPAGKQMIHHAAASSTVPIASLLTGRPLSGGEQDRWRQAWDDAAAQTRKRLLRGAEPSGVVAPGFGAPIIVRRVPHVGGIAQEVGQSLNDVLDHQKRWRRSGGAAAAASGSVSGSGGAAGASRAGAALGSRRKNRAPC